MLAKVFLFAIYCCQFLPVQSQWCRLVFGAFRTAPQTIKVCNMEVMPRGQASLAPHAALAGNAPLVARVNRLHPVGTHPCTHP